MRPVRLRIVTALVLAIVMLGSLASGANAALLSTGGSRLVAKQQPVQTSTFSANGKGASPMAFPEDPWPGLTQSITSFPEDPWPGLSN
jgi:hypothetical protein